MGSFDSIYRLFPRQIAESISNYIQSTGLMPEEIRIRLGQPVTIRCAGWNYSCPTPAITASDMNTIVLNATNGNFHGVIDQIRNGYFALPNGCRMGICGEGTVRGGTIHSIRNVSSICIRIAHEQRGCADEIFREITRDGFHNTIIIGQPGAGKTTLLRELIRKLSESGMYVGVADERGEISGQYQGVNAFRLGTKTDVLTGIPKQQAAMMLLRTMAPDVLAMDEITALRDLPAIIEATECGVGLLTTIHGQGLNSLKKRTFASISETKAFEYAVIIDANSGKRSYRLEKLYA